MDLFKLDSKQVADYGTRGFKLLEPLQQDVFKILCQDQQAPALSLTWDQLRGCVFYIFEEYSGRRERVRN